jgi:hypothetical protein
MFGKLLTRRILTEKSLYDHKKIKTSKGLVAKVQIVNKDKTKNRRLAIFHELLSQKNRFLCCEANLC